ncbi:MAG: flagellar brake protein [FCB group bacterium]|nr:flagellar brake protein [FCB group bacterium]
MKEATKTGSVELPLRVWERLQLVVGDEGQEGVYNCRVSDITNDRLIISRPAFAYGKSLLADNRRVAVQFTRSDAAYAFNARLKETEPKSDDAMYLLDLGEVSRRQRRRFVRLEKMITFKYHLLPRPLGAVPDLSALAKSMTIARTQNISAGGLLTAAGDDIDVGSLLLLDFAGSGLKNIPRFLIAVCRRSEKSSTDKQVVGVEFILRDALPQYLKKHELKLIPGEAGQFTPFVQNLLVSELFAEQLILRQKGLL